MSTTTISDSFITGEMEEDFKNDVFNSSSSFSNSTCVPPQLHPTSNFVLVVAYLLIVVVGLLGNTLVIYVVLRFSKMQTVTNIYIVNMAIADECFLTSIPFLIATTIVKSWPFGRTMCKIYFVITGINQFTSSTFITIMAADRYIAICHPITSPKLRTPTISKVVAVLAWTASAAMIFPVVLYADAVNDGAGGHYSCNIIWPTTNSTTTSVMRIFNTFTLYSFTLTFAIPVILILKFYVLVIRKLQTVGPKNKSKELKKSHRKVTKLVLTVITVYVFCWTPYWVGQLVLSFQSSDTEEGLICHVSDGESLFVLYHLITSILATANSAMNPVLYAFLSDNFKKSFLKACVCATKTDVNACLQVENSVFPKRANRQGSEKNKAIRVTSQGTGADEMNEEAHLVSRGDHSTMTTTTTASRFVLPMKSQGLLKRSSVEQFTRKESVPHGTAKRSLKPGRKLSNATCSSDVNVIGTSDISATREVNDRQEAVNNGINTASAATAV